MQQGEAKKRQEKVLEEQRQQRGLTSYIFLFFPRRRCAKVHLEQRYTVFESFDTHVTREPITTRDKRRETADGRDGTEHLAPDPGRRERSIRPDRTHDTTRLCRM